MAITTYAQLTTAVGNWLNRSDLTSYLDDICTLGEKWINRNVRSRQMEQTFTLTVGASVAGAIAVPSDYVELKSAYIDGNPTMPLQRRSVEFIYQGYPLRSADGKPNFIARESSNFIFGPYPDSAYVVKGVYYKRLVALATTVNTMFTDNPDLYLFAALAEAEVFLKNDSRVAVWQDRRNIVANDINKEDRWDNSSGSALSVVAG